MSHSGTKTSQMSDDELPASDSIYQMSNSMVDSMSDNMLDSKIDSMSDYELPISDSKLNDKLNNKPNDKFNKPNDKFSDKLNGKISEAIKTIELEEVVEKLPDGIDTPLGKIRENGVDLSGGEWQRVAIARALVSNAPIHILDEPTAALDPVAESRIYEMFGRVSAGKSTIFITHRLGAAKLADEILVINEGCVTEKGSHNELMAKGGIYADMFESQRSWYN
jgi:ABC-type transport system involved in Fe-S cluster assembly fused permease/ATPase subunit